MSFRLALLFVLFSITVHMNAQYIDPYELSTFSIIARDPATGELGAAFQSKAFAGGNRIFDAKGGVAVIAHQAVSNPMYGLLGLDLLEAGMTPEEALQQMVGGDPLRNRRQVAIVDMKGRTAGWTGPGTDDWKGHHCGTDYCAEGNTLTGPEVLNGMVHAFESSSGPLAERLLAALDAAQAAGGDLRGVQSAALMIVKPLAGASGFSDRAIDIRVDDSKVPLVELRRLLNMARSNDLVADANRSLTAGDFKSALDFATKARDRSPENDICWIALATVYVKMENPKEALAALKRAGELNPANVIRMPQSPLFEALYKSQEKGK